MIAKLLIQTPFLLHVPNGMNFTDYELIVDGCKVRFFPPGVIGELSPGSERSKLKIDDGMAFAANCIRIEFSKPEFDRSPQTRCDPPFELINDILESYLNRLRYVTKAPDIRSLKLPEISWQLEYLDDHGNQLERCEGLVRGRGGLSYSFSYVAFTNRMWDDLHALPTDYRVPPWEPLLLDAALRGIPTGSAVVLAATALEVFAGTILERLAARSTVPGEFWNWVNNRPDRRTEPSVEEQFDTLIRILCGHSLKEDAKLWESFQNLKSARNNFVHEGMVALGKNKIPLGAAEARQLVVSAREIIARIREWLPQEIRWCQFDHKVRIEAVHQLLPP